ncbi:MAG: hypothetical protein V5A29_16200 [Haloarculaceae archaeon]
MTTDAVEAIEPVDDTGSIRSEEQYKRQCAEAVVTALDRDAERIKHREVEEAIGRLEARRDLGDVERDAVEELADSIVEEFLAAPSESLRQTPDWATVHTALQLFEPEFETTEGRTHADGSALPEGDDED